MRYLDTHYHLDLHENPEVMASEIERKEVYTIAVTNAPSVFDYTYKITENKKYIKPAIGLHPELALQRKRELELFRKELRRTRYVGEVGLDYGNLKPSEVGEQKAIFEKILSLCAEYKNKILTVHSRGTAADVIAMIGNNFPGKVILHWYSGSLKELRKAVQYGFYFSINSAMTKSKNGQKIINNVPLERMLTESDGPFITHLKSNSNPFVIPYVINSLANLYAVDNEVIISNVYKNFKQILLL